jgi:hypothetical protein
VKRRIFLASALCLAAINSKARAQSAGDLPRLAILSPDPASGRGEAYRFLEALRGLGHIDGQNIRLDTRFAENRLELLPALAAELVKRRPDVPACRGICGSDYSWRAAERSAGRAPSTASRRRTGRSRRASSKGRRRRSLISPRPDRPY